MRIFYSEKAIKQLQELPYSTQKRIAEKMLFYASQENPLAFAKHLIDYREGGFRFRIGDHRATFDVEKNTIYILTIKKRDKAYD